MRDGRAYLEDLAPHKHAVTKSEQSVVVSGDGGLRYGSFDGAVYLPAVHGVRSSRPSLVV